ncbi:CRISPR-associated endonuclease Cas1 [Bifidobacterium adolescentis]|nr:CRISPR-associated endonuclease Cas1 [Bifidobacterium adolescentis]KAB5850956.1 CRISPR-associated endonuclease Cas1 [Bifidobacterium adolescentis]KAB5853572.1 CRISPR-associated endonuclease Cas1 [Bifidobacterium adolescentis]KAB5860783.1 CRISPR-associated endonuclease Cas1 [Bifidobacterium adolescentis]KAB5868756.1 CRISPR-associated endonuclease Cas1 [Bifidobacterium adolescentis]
MMLLSGMAARPAFQLRFFVWRLKIVHRTRAMPASTSQRRTKPKVRRNSDVIRVNSERIAEQSEKLRQALLNARDCRSIDELRGIEGLAAKDYFFTFDDLILRNKDDFFFQQRSRRPPLDRVNALMSFVYSILTSDCIAALQGVGLDPYVGFMHTDRPGRASLALDLVEEFRPTIADRFVLTLINTGTIKPSQFEIRENSGVFLSEDGRKTVLAAWQKRKQETLTHPFFNEKMPWGLVPHAQALLLNRAIRGDLDAYPPFMWK